MKLFDKDSRCNFTKCSDALVGLIQSNNKTGKDVKDLLEKCWVSYEPYKENNFISDFYGEGFRQRCWELYFWYRLADLGGVLNQPGSGMPDVKLILDNESIFIECVSPTDGEGENKIRVTNSSTTVQKVPKDKVLLRITGAIRNKSKQAKNREDKVGNSPYIIAIDVSQLKRWGFDEDYYFRSVYPVGNPIVYFESNHIFSKGRASHEVALMIKKSKDVTVSTTSFLNGTEYSHISAILYCDADLSKITHFGHEQFTLVHNFKATNPLSPNFFKNHKQYFYDGNSRLFLY